MKRKIHFVVSIADRFVEEPTGLYKMLIPQGEKLFDTNLVIEFEQVSEDPIKDAYEALRKYVSENYPTKDFLTYYWTLEIV